MWRETGSESIEVPAEVLERARCDAQEIGRVDTTPEPAAAVASAETGSAEPPIVASGAAHVGRARRASQTVPPAVRRQVTRRDRGRCRVPGCRNHRYVDVHHIRLRSEGGDHDPRRLILLCGAHHARVHEGLLILSGEDEGALAFAHADGTSYGAAPVPEDVDAFREAFSALRHLGFGETEAKRGLAAARAAHVGHGASVSEIVRTVLRLRTGVTDRVGGSAGAVAMS